MRATDTNELLSSADNKYATAAWVVDPLRTMPVHFSAIYIYLR
jgi:hypothetical protein